MSLNKDWDVDSYKTEHECDEHWELRRSFMIAHKDKFPEDQLVCLAQVFTNVEFLGCRYPTETMQIVAKLSKGVVDDYREKKKDKLQRTFVKASDAACAKAKGLKRTLQEGKTSEATPELNIPAKKLHTQTQVHVEQNSSFSYTHSSMKVTYGPSIGISELQNTGSLTSRKPAHDDSSRFNDPRCGDIKTNKVGQSSADESGTPISHPMEIGPYGKFIVVEQLYIPMNANIILAMSAAACKANLEFKYTKEQPNIICKVFLNNKYVSYGVGNKKGAARLASEEALKKLKELYYTVQVKQKIVSESTIDKSFDISQNSINSKTEERSADVPLDNNNIGNKLLKMMGWSGGGLGKDQQGIAEPVQVQQQVSRAGLGLKGMSSRGPGFGFLKHKIKELIDNYIRSDSQYDLVFSTDFTKEERKMIHMFAQKFRFLKTKSHGVDQDRYLVISKKKSIWDTVNELLTCGGSNERYELMKPTGSENN